MEIAERDALRERIAGVLLTQLMVDGVSRTTAELLELIGWLDTLEAVD